MSISNEARQSMVNADKTAYNEALAAKRQQTALRREERIKSISDFFTTHTVHKMEKGKAYSMDNMLSIYKGPDNGMFYHMLLNDMLPGLEHTRNMPALIKVTYVPPNPVQEYARRYNALMDKIIAFTADTGLSVKAPKVVTESHITALVEVAQKALQEDKFIKWSDFRYGAYSWCLSAQDWKTLEDIGVEYEKVKTVSAFWI